MTASKVARQRGFTLIELIVVIFVMAILGSIAFQMASKVQMRARDSERISDLAQLKHLLGLFFSTYDRYPDTADTCTNPNTGWNDSNYSSSSPTACIAPNQFIYELYTSRLVAQVMVDPLNDSTYYYSYHRYTSNEAAAMGCPAKAFYVLGIRRFEALAVPPSDSGFSCGNRNFQDEFDYVVGAYEE